MFLCIYFLFIFFFFSSRRRHTRSKRDWSSDVCSSDLCCFSFGSTVSCKCRISFALSCAFIISFCMVRNSAISISRPGFGGISCSRIKFCRKSLALFTLLRNRPGSQPLLLIDWLAFSCISVCLTSILFDSEIPDNNAMSAVLFYSCLAALSALISSSLGLFLSFFFAGGFVLFLVTT